MRTAFGCTWSCQQNMFACWSDPIKGLSQNEHDVVQPHRETSVEKCDLCICSINLSIPIRLLSHYWTLLCFYCLFGLFGDWSKPSRCRDAHSAWMNGVESSSAYSCVSVIMFSVRCNASAVSEGDDPLIREITGRDSGHLWIQFEWLCTCMAFKCELKIDLLLYNYTRS